MRQLSALPLLIVLLSVAKPVLPPCHKLSELEKLINVAKEIELHVPKQPEAPHELVIGKMP